jgi:hypothetical protein
MGGWSGSSRVTLAVAMPAVLGLAGCGGSSQEASGSPPPIVVTSSPETSPSPGGRYRAGRGLCGHVDLSPARQLVRNLATKEADDQSAVSSGFSRFYCDFSGEQQLGGGKRRNIGLRITAQVYGNPADAASAYGNDKKAERITCATGQRGRRDVRGIGADGYADHCVENGRPAMHLYKMYIRDDNLYLRLDVQVFGSVAATDPSPDSTALPSQGAVTAAAQKLARQIMSRLRAS